MSKVLVVTSGKVLAIDDILDILSVPLLGIIPESRHVLAASNLGVPVTLGDPDSPPARAYIDAALRLCGTSVPMAIPTERRGLFGAFFGRRAA